MSFKDIPENKIIVNISEFIVVNLLRRWYTHSAGAQKKLQLGMGAAVAQW